MSKQDWLHVLSFSCSLSLFLLMIYTFLFHYLIYRLQDYDATCRLAQEIAENIHERNRQQRTGGNPAKVRCSSLWNACKLSLSLLVGCCDCVLSFQINMTLRASLQKLKQNIGSLQDGLLRSSSSRRMYPFLLRMFQAVGVMRCRLELMLEALLPLQEQVSSYRGHQSVLNRPVSYFRASVHRLTSNWAKEKCQKHPLLTLRAQKMSLKCLWLTVWSF